MIIFFCLIFHCSRVTTSIPSHIPMASDRLCEFRAIAPAHGTAENDAVEVVAPRFVARYDDISRALDVILECTKDLDRLRDREQMAPNERARASVALDVATQTSRARESAARVKRLLADAANDDASAADLGAARAQQYQLYQRRFARTMMAYNCALRAFEGAQRAGAKRRVLVVAPAVPMGVVDELVDAGQASDFIREAVVSEDVDAVVQELIERYESIRKLERSAVAIHALFQDFAIIIDTQEEMLNVVAERVKSARDSTVAGGEVLHAAEAAARRTHKRACCIFVSVLVVLAVVGVPLASRFVF